MCYSYIPTPHKEYNHYVLHTHTNKNFKKQNFCSLKLSFNQKVQSIYLDIRFNYTIFFSFYFFFHVTVFPLISYPLAFTHNPLFPLIILSYNFLNIFLLIISLLDFRSVVDTKVLTLKSDTWWLPGNIICFLQEFFEPSQLKKGNKLWLASIFHYSVGHIYKAKLL